MSKFKVGDRVRVYPGMYIGMTAGSPYNLPRGEGVVSRCGDGYLVVQYGETVSPPVNPKCFELVTPSPIRTVTRREIAPGVYGNVEIEEVGQRYVVIDSQSIYYAEDLREAAHLFNQLAEVLEENAASGKAAA